MSHHKVTTKITFKKVTEINSVVVTQSEKIKGVEAKKGETNQSRHSA